jgi:type 1 glutamine amidotransferase
MIRNFRYSLRSLVLAGFVSAFAFSVTPAPAADAAPRKIILIAGKQSHPPLMHEFRAGSLLLQKCLADFPGVTVEVHDNGWVRDEADFDGAAAVIVYADGGGGHPALQGDHLKTLEGLVAKGVGFGCMHYGVEVPAGEGGDAFKKWIGGHYEHQYSCNPIWDASMEKYPEHPVARGVKPFKIRDEWYFNLRFAGDITGNEATTVEGLKFTPIFVSLPSDDVRDGPYVYPQGPYEHIVANAGRAETMMWTVERPDGGRGFGFTGGHFHLNWGDDDFRKAVLNAIVWVAKAEVPVAGVASSVAEPELFENLDPKGPLPKEVQEKIEGWKKAKDGTEGASLVPVPSKFEQLVRLRSQQQP